MHLIRASGPPTQAPTNLSGQAPTSGELPTAIPADTQVKSADGQKACESCYATVSNKWHVWGDATRGCRVCNHCMNYWRKYGGLKLPTSWEHHEKHPEQIYTCGQCKKQFNRQERLTNHLRQHQPFCCQVSGCGRAFKSKSTLRRHISGQHQNQPGYPMQPLISPFLMFANSLSLFTRTKFTRENVYRMCRNPFKSLPPELIEVPEDAEFPLKVRRKGLLYTKKRSMHEVMEQLNESALTHTHPTSPIVRFLMKGSHLSKPMTALPDPPTLMPVQNPKRHRPTSIDGQTPASKMIKEETGAPSTLSHFNVS